ncbi:MAG: hypothetical protein ABIW31_08085, partial [Novosphingobium sp.]
MLLAAALLFLVEAAPEPGRRIPGGAEGPPPPSPSVMDEPGSAEPPPDVESGVIKGRKRPGYQHALPARVVQDNLGALRAPPPEAFPTDQLPVPDR